MNKKIVAVDCGKADTKVYAYDTKTGGIRSVVIRSKVEPVNSLVKLTLGDDAHVVSFGKSYPDMAGEWTVGAIGGDTSYSNSKKDAVHKILTLAAIALTVDNGDSVIASAGCPLSVFQDDAQKAEYFEYLFPNGRVDVTVDGESHYFYIEKDKCMIFPESFGALFLYEDRFTEETGIVDIGGLNVNAAYFYNGVLDPFNSKTEKLGYYSLISVLRNRLNAVCDAGFNDTAVELFLKQGYVTGSKETAKVIEDVERLHVERIEKILKIWDLQSTTLIFIGGTSKLLQRYIEQCFGKKTFIPDEANLINCRGFLKAMLTGYGIMSPF